MSRVGGPIIFLAVSMAEEKEHPRSVKVADALMRQGHNAIVLPTLEEARIVSKGSRVVSLVDTDDYVDRWSPEQINARWTPNWAKTYSTSGWWVAVGKLRLALPREAMDALAGQIAQRFFVVDKSEDETWGPTPAEKTYSVTGRQLPMHGWSQGRIR